MELFGGLALVVAALHFVRPRFALFAAGVAAAVAGLILYNTGPAALAVALLVVSLARPVHASRP
jgi:hypothetical protein